MDPDMVRQQEEAEREALGLVQRKPPVHASNIAAAVSRAAYSSAASSLPPPSFEKVRAAGPQPRMQQQRKHAAFSAWDFMSFGMAGAILGGGIGITAANILRLTAEQTQWAFFGPAALMSILCAFASLFTGRQHT